MTQAETLVGKLAVAPGPTSPCVDESVVTLINERIQPPKPVTAHSIHVRSLRLISDEVNDHGGRFPTDEHERLCELIVDSPVLIGHDRTRLPMARNFAAQTRQDGDRQWINVWFYWMRGPRGDRLAADIDGGVIKEGSIGFEFRTPRCSICGLDIRRCDHVPGESYTLDTGKMDTAHYEYRDIVRVLETSLVYRGATPGTRIGNEAVFCKTPPTEYNREDDARSEPVIALVLEHSQRRDNLNEYLVARRDPDDPSVCDEFSMISTGCFEVGDLVVRTGAVWRRLGTVQRPTRVSISLGSAKQFR